MSCLSVTMCKYLGWQGSPWLSQMGVVPVHVPKVVQFLSADPDRVKPSWHEKLCVSPTRNHCLLGHKSPWSSCSWAGHKISEPFKKENKTADEVKKDWGCVFFFLYKNGICRIMGVLLQVACDTSLWLVDLIGDHSPSEPHSLWLTGWGYWPGPQWKVSTLPGSPHWNGNRCG